MRVVDSSFYGWANRSTWAAAQLLTENPDFDRHRRDLCQQTLARCGSRSERRHFLANALQDWVSGLAAQSHREREYDANVAQFLSDIVLLARRHRACAPVIDHAWMTPDQLLALSLEAWAVALSDTLIQDETGSVVLFHVFEDIGPIADVDWHEIADTFLVEVK